MGTESRDPKTDPQPGDTIHDQFGERWTVDSVDALGVRFTDGSGMTLRTWRGYFDDPNYTVTAADGNALAEGSEGPAPDPSPLDRLGTDAQTLVTLLRAAALAAAPGTPQYARDAAEGWLRGVFAATYGTTAADAPATDRDPRTDPRPGDTKTWWDDEEHYTQTVAAVDHAEHYAVSIEETHTRTGDDVTFDDLTLDDWSNSYSAKGAEWFAGGAS